MQVGPIQTTLRRPDKIAMDTWGEERREVLESVLEALGRTAPHPLVEEHRTVCLFLLRHLLNTSVRRRAFGDPDAEDSRHELRPDRRYGQRHGPRRRLLSEVPR